MKSIIKCVDHGTRMIMGAEFSIESYLVKEPRKPGGLPGGDWLVTIRACNGIAENAKRFKTRKAAIAYLEDMEKQNI